MPVEDPVGRLKELLAAGETAGNCYLTPEGDDLSFRYQVTRPKLSGRDEETGYVEGRMRLELANGLPARFTVNLPSVCRVTAPGDVGIAMPSALPRSIVLTDYQRGYYNSLWSAGQSARNSSTLEVWQKTAASLKPGMTLEEARLVMPPAGPARATWDGRTAQMDFALDAKCVCRARFAAKEDQLVLVEAPTVMPATGSEP
jgi:hypothetical protein